MRISTILVHMYACVHADMVFSMQWFQFVVKCIVFMCRSFRNVLRHRLVLIRLRYEIKRVFGTTVVVAILLSRFLLVQSLLCFYSLFFCVGKKY